MGKQPWDGMRSLTPKENMMPSPARIGIFTTHPIQYFAPVWRHLSNDTRFHCTTYSFSQQGLSRGFDDGFGQEIAWDVPVTQGFNHEFLTTTTIAKAAHTAIPNIEDFLTQERFDIVLAHSYRYQHAHQLIRFRKRYGYKMVLRGEFSDLSLKQSPLWKKVARFTYLKWLYRKIDAFSSIGQDATYHLRRHGVGLDRIYQAPYCVDDELIEHQIKAYPRDLARKQLGITPEQCVVLFSGKLIPRKQPEMLAEALARLPQNKLVTVIFLGSGTLSDRINDTLRPTFCNRLIMPGFVNQSELGKFFSAADIFSLPTAHDTWGLVVNEAMHWGLPCIISNQAGSTRDLILEGETGFTHAADDVEGLARLLWLCISNDKIRKKIGAAGKTRAEGFRSKVTANCLAETFARVLGIFETPLSPSKQHISSVL